MLHNMFVHHLKVLGVIVFCFLILFLLFKGLYIALKILFIDNSSLLFLSVSLKCVIDWSFGNPRRMYIIIKH